MVHQFEDALKYAENHGEQEVMVVGGSDIYRLSLPHADYLYLTEVLASVDGDVYFPEFDRAEWNEVSREHNPADERHKYAFDFVLYERKRND